MLDVQKDLRSRLARAFPEASVHRFTPAEIPDYLITIRREGGRRRNKLIDGPGIGIFCWAPTEIEASGLAEDVADLMDGLSFPDGYASVEQEAMYSAPDPDMERPRWYLSYTIKTYQPKGTGNA